jgi:ubiquinone/menaquinone biosynthesis C-methylase UbiE
MSQIEWSEETSRVYAKYMETNIPYDHRRWAEQIVADWPDFPAGATVVDVAGGPAFLLLELAPRLFQPRLIVADNSPIMISLARERAAQQHLAIETILCPADQLSLPEASADLVVCKHFLRMAPNLEAVLRETARILRPGGRAYFIDFNGEASLFKGRLLHLWILLTAPRFLSKSFWPSLRRGLKVSSLPEKLRASGFADTRILGRGLSFLVRADRGESPHGGVA